MFRFGEFIPGVLRCYLDRSTGAPMLSTTFSIFGKAARRPEKNFEWFHEITTQKDQFKIK